MMGDAADLVLEAAEGEYWADYEEKQHLFNLSDQELIKLTAGARTEKIKSIRRYSRPLTDKQKWCLVFWIVEHGESY